MKKAGVLMPIASLPSNHGIGDFGKSSYNFVDLISKAGFKIWQILPLNPLGYGNSPYQPYSSYAMDELYISLDMLKKKKLIKHLSDFYDRKDRILYNEVRDFKKPFLIEAFNNFKEDDNYHNFINNNAWVKAYAEFITLKKKNNLKCWVEWDNKELTGDDDEHIRYEMFIQYVLYMQWNELKKYANDKGIEIMGDIPFYVGLDSEDVYDHKECFLLDSDGRPSFIAGVPPDYFSATGQRWGNPIYDWDHLMKHDFDFWINRIAYTAKMFDIIRIDHFRAFDTYWKINASCPTAIDGKWVEAPGYAFFDTLFAKYKDIHIVAEDLGDLRPEVLVLRDHYHFKGMNVIEFTFDPKNVKPIAENMIVYTGTHDNQTLRGWYKGNSLKYKRACTKYFKENGYNYDLVNDNFISYAFNSDAKMAIIPLFDLLNKDDKYRSNTPGTIGDPNWQAKINSFDEFKKVLPKYKKMIKNSGR